MGLIKHGEDFFLRANAIARAMGIDVLEVFFCHWHDEVAAIFPFQPFHELDIAPTCFPLVEDIELRIVVFACDVIAINGLVKIKIRLVFHVAPRFDALAQVIGDGLCEPDNGVPHIFVAEIEHARTEDRPIVAASRAHVFGYEPIDIDTVIIFRIPLEEAPRVRVVSINQDAFMHRFQHDVVEDFSECLQLLQHVHRPPFSICTPAGISRSLSRPMPAQRSQMLMQPRSFTSPSR